MAPLRTVVSAPLRPTGKSPRKQPTFFTKSTCSPDGLSRIPLFLLRFPAGLKDNIWDHYLNLFACFGTDHWRHWQTDIDRVARNPAPLSLAIEIFLERQRRQIQCLGLNRSPLNLISFLLQETWFDKHPGVIELPCLDPQAARNWRGESYSMIILCRDVPSMSTADTGFHW